MTIAVVAICHAFSNNKYFQPDFLYIGAFLVDINFWEYVLK